MDIDYTIQSILSMYRAELVEFAKKRSLHEGHIDLSEEGLKEVLANLVAKDNWDFNVNVFLVSEKPFLTSVIQNIKLMFWCGKKLPKTDGIYLTIDAGFASVKQNQINMIKSIIVDKFSVFNFCYSNNIHYIPKDGIVNRIVKLLKPFILQNEEDLLAKFNSIPGFIAEEIVRIKSLRFKELSEVINNALKSFGETVSDEEFKEMVDHLTDEAILNRGVFA
jgi:hypothetical protein